MKIAFIFIIFLLVACAPAIVVEEGDLVGVKYEGKYLNGTVFDSNMDSSALLKFTVGDGGLIQGFDEGVIGMRQGQKLTIEIPPEKGYGLSDPELIRVLSFEEFETEFPQIEVELDRMFSFYKPNGRMSFTRISEINETHVTLDANHRLAGQILVFDVIVVELEKTN